MDEIEIGQLEAIKAANDHECSQVLDETPKINEACEFQPEINVSSVNSRSASEKLSMQVMKMSTLSSDIVKLLSDLCQEAREFTDQLCGFQSEVELKRQELKMLHDIDASAAAFKTLQENHRSRMEDLERIMEDQRGNWEREKIRQEQEAIAYQENMRIRRQMEEEEYQQSLAAQGLAAKNELEMELQAMRMASLENQRTLEVSLREREQLLERSELEWNTFRQQLQQFLLFLDRQFQSNAEMPFQSNKEPFPEHLNVNKKGSSSYESDCSQLELPGRPNSVSEEALACGTSEEAAIETSQAE